MQGYVPRPDDDGHVPGDCCRCTTSLGDRRDGGFGGGLFQLSGKPDERVQMGSEEVSTRSDPKLREDLAQVVLDSAG
jgi:hypothetical protein